MMTPTTFDMPDVEEEVDELEGLNEPASEEEAASDEAWADDNVVTLVDQSADAATQAAADFKAKLHEATDDVAAKVLARMAAEAAYKHAKAEEKLAAETLQKIVNRGPEHYPLFDGEKAASDTNGRVDLRNSTLPTGAALHDPQAAWKHIPIMTLGERPYGLSKGIIEKLTSDGIDTIGRLEQRRADVSNKKEKWPKGIGKSAIDKIEDAIIDWLGANQPPPAESAPSSEAATTEDELVPVHEKKAKKPRRQKAKAGT